MTILQKLQLRQSEIREKLNTLLGLETRTEEQGTELSKLTAEGQKIEPEIRAAIIAAPDEQKVTTITVDPETRERAEIREKFVGLTDGFVAPALRGQLPSGAAAEYAASLGCRAHETPIQLIMQPQLETRAVTSPGTTGTELQPTTPAVFPRSLHAELGVLTPMVAPGVAAFPIMTTNVSGGARVMLKGVASDATAGVMSTKSVSPRRLPGTIETAVEDQALMPSLESDTVRNLQDVLANLFDQVIINGQVAVTNESPAITGVIGFTTAATAESTVLTFETYSAKFLGAFDGLLANGPGECIALVNLATAKNMLRTFSSSAPISAWAHLVANMRSVRAWKHLAALTSKVGPAYVIQAGVEGRCAAPIWSGLELVRDPYTNSKKGMVSITATMLVGDPQELRDGFVVPVSVKIA